MSNAPGHARPRSGATSALLDGLTGTASPFGPGAGTSAGRALASDRCKIDTLHEAGLLTGTDRDGDRLRLTRYVLNSPAGTPLPEIYRDVFGVSDASDGSDADYAFTRRFYNDHPDYFKLYDINGMTAVESQLKLIDLIAQGITQKTGSDPAPSDRAYCRNLLASTSELADSHKTILRDRFYKYVRRVSDLRLVFELQDLRSGATTPLLKDYSTRFTDRGRINKSWARYNAALEHAYEAHDNAVLATLTTDPKKHDNLLSAIDAVTSNLNRLMAWMDYRPTTKPTSRPGYRPPYLCAIEFSEKGFPHLHVLLFDVPERDNGMPWLIDKSELSEKWDQLGQGRIVDLQPLVYRDELPDRYEATEGFIAYSEATGDDRGSDRSGSMEFEAGTTAGQYLGKYLSATFGGILDVATDGGIDVDGTYSEKSTPAKVALYWATGRRFFTLSRDIERSIAPADDPERDLPVRVRFVGTYPFWDLPGRVLDRSRPFIDYSAARWPGEGGSAGPAPGDGGSGDRPPPTPAD